MIPVRYATMLLQLKNDFEMSVQGWIWLDTSMSLRMSQGVEMSGWFYIYVLELTGLH